MYLRTSRPIVLRVQGLPLGVQNLLSVLDRILVDFVFHVFERDQLAGGFQGQMLAELRTDQRPQIKKSGLVDVRRDCLVSFGYPSTTTGVHVCVMSKCTHPEL